MALGRFDNNKIKTLIANTLVYLSPALFFLSLFDRVSLGSQTVYLTELCEHNLKSLLYFAFSLAVMVCVGIDPARFKKAVLFSKSGWNLLLLLKNGFRIFRIFKVDNVSGKGSLSNALKLLHDLGKTRAVIAKLPNLLPTKTVYCFNSNIAILA